MRYSCLVENNGILRLRDEQGRELSIQLKAIIAIFKKPDGYEDEHHLLYVVSEANPSRDEAIKGSLTFKHLVLVGCLAHVLDQFPVNPDSYLLASLAKAASRALIEHPARVIVSTGSGTGTASTAWSKLLQPLLSYLGHEENKHYVVHETRSEDSVAEIVRTHVLPVANAGHPQPIILLSGDGGVVDIVNTLISAPRSNTYQRPTLHLLPLGTGNALANSSGLTGPDDTTLGLRAMISGSPSPTPLFRATFSPGARFLTNEGRREEEIASGNAHGAVVCSWGHHAALVADSDTAAYRKHGAERFKMAAQEALFPSDGSPPHPYTGRISIRKPGDESGTWHAFPDDSTTAHGYVLATFVSQLEAGFTISPASKPLDGKLRLVYFGALTGKEAMDVMGGAFAGGKHVDDERVRYEEIEAIRIDFVEDDEDGRWRRVCVDGKIIRVEKDGWVEVTTGVDAVVDLVRRRS